MASPTIIDVHMHLYPTRERATVSRQSYEVWEYGEKPDTRFSKCVGLADEAVGEMRKAGMSKAVVLASASPAFRERRSALASLPQSLSSEERAKATKEIDAAMLSRVQEVNAWACVLAKLFPQLIPFIGVDPRVLSIEEGIEHIRDMVDNHGAKGIKVHPVIQEFYPGDQRMWPVYELFQERGLTILSHSGPARGADQYADPRAFVPVLKAFPRLTLVLAHMGGGMDAWRQTREVALVYPNAYFDCCEIIEWTGGSSAPSDLQLARLIKDIGPSRVMMGSDYPWYDLDHSVQRVMELPLLANEEKETILGANAVRILGL